MISLQPGFSLFFFLTYHEIPFYFIFLWDPFLICNHLELEEALFLESRLLLLFMLIDKCWFQILKLWGWLK